MPKLKQERAEQLRATIENFVQNTDVEIVKKSYNPDHLSGYETIESLGDIYEKIPPHSFIFFFLDRGVCPSPFNVMGAGDRCPVRTTPRFPPTTT